MIYRKVFSKQGISVSLLNQLILTVSLFSLLKAKAMSVLTIYFWFWCYIHIYMCVCVCVCIYIYIYIYIYTYMMNWFHLTFVKLNSSHIYFVILIFQVFLIESQSWKRPQRSSGTILIQCINPLQLVKLIFNSKDILQASSHFISKLN